MTRRAWCSSFALALSAAFVAVGGGIAQAATTCPAGSDRWNGSGAWSSAGGWSSGQVPQSQTNANFGYFGVPTDSGYETHGGFDALSGTIVNDGSITSETTGDETPNLLEGNFDNVGTLPVDNTLDGQAGNWTLGGSVQNGSGQQIALETGSSGSGSLNLTGTIDNGGSFTIGDGISITATSGTDSGNGFLLGTTPSARQGRDRGRSISRPAVPSSVATSRPGTPYGGPEYRASRTATSLRRAATPTTGRWNSDPPTGLTEPSPFRPEIPSPTPGR